MGIAPANGATNESAAAGRVGVPEARDAVVVHRVAAVRVDGTEYVVETGVPPARVEPGVVRAGRNSLVPSGHSHCRILGRRQCGNAVG